MHGIQEEKPKLVLHEDVIPLRRGDIWKAARTWVQAFKDDPELHYRRDNEQESEWTSYLDRIVIASIFSLLIKSNVALTINSGAAFIFASPAQCGSQSGPIDKVMEVILKGLTAILYRKVGSAQQRSRNKEVEEKTREIVKDVLGDSIKDLLRIIVLATEPESQEVGYGGALLDAVTSLGDIIGQGSYVLCSNTRAAGFYMLHGFEIVGTIIFGEKDPTWRQQPVVTRIVSTIQFCGGADADDHDTDGSKATKANSFELHEKG